ncbi:MlaE family ABC transporter permease [Entomobacter blattae]|uniref:Permease MlaE n=1 Tax=Entomobacter blattae TaxID=2762277 RepID=A0A7H1NRD4_9PROT|nr:ABC transporter permease [Entomobacter blattae]QNT78344.1 Permease MlaE [Entomobacter blattae]
MRLSWAGLWSSRWFITFFRWLGFIGRVTRTHVRFFLVLVGTAWGVLRESVNPLSWRRTVVYEFRRTLSQAVGGGVMSTLFTATLTGIAIISQTIYWLGVAGMDQMTGSILATILLREVAPILVGIIMLGRSGMLAVAECGQLTRTGTIRLLESQGVDPFTFFVMSRAFSFTISSFTLGILFSFTALFVGYIISYSVGTTSSSVWFFFNTVLLSMTAWDYILVPLKFVTIGFFIGLGSTLTGLLIQSNESVSSLLPRAFARGILMVMFITVLFSININF